MAKLPARLTCVEVEFPPAAGEESSLGMQPGHGEKRSLRQFDRTRLVRTLQIHHITEIFGKEFRPILASGAPKMAASAFLGG
jgi:hypothetical protein